MNIITKQFFALSTALVGGLSFAHADPFVFTNGDLILGVQATGGVGGNRNVFFNLGAGTALRDNPSQGLKGNIGVTLSNVFGTDWYTRADLYFGVIANLRGNANSGFGSAPAVNNDPSRTFYLSTATAAPGEGTLAAAATYPSASLAAGATNLSGLEIMLVGDTANAGLTAELDGSAVLDQTAQPVQWANSWTNWNPVPGAAFNVFTGGIQQSFGKATPSTYVDVQRVLSTNTGAVPTGVIGGGTYEATIAISSTGAITTLSSSPASAYNSWIGGFGISAPADLLPTADPDFDGFTNQVEFVLNGNPGVSNQAIAPTLNASDANFVFNFTRRADSTTEVTQVFEYSTDLVDWTTNSPITIPTTPGTVGFATVGASTGTAPNLVQAVTLTIPKGSNTKLFGRLKAVK
jgi:hypothetical protein